MKGSKKPANKGALIVSSLGRPLGQADIAEIERLTGEKLTKYQVLDISRKEETSFLLEGTETLLAKLGYKAYIKTPDNPFYHLLLAGDQLTGEYVKLTLTPPGQPEQDVVSITATDLFGHPPDVSNTGLKFYFFGPDLSQEYSRQKEIY